MIWTIRNTPAQLLANYQQLTYDLDEVYINLIENHISGLIRAEMSLCPQKLIEGRLNEPLDVCSDYSQDRRQITLGTKVGSHKPHLLKLQARK